MAAGDARAGRDGFAAFISYAHHDGRRARWLHRTLETYRLPRAVARQLGRERLGRVFLDRSELATSSSLSERIAEALTASENLVVVCSPAARGSRWVNEEIRRFRALGRGDRIFCLIVDGDPARADAQGCFPPTLLERADGTVPVEPLAADLRPGKDRPADAQLKLLAGLFGVPFDTLHRREQVRRQRFLTVVAAASLSLVVILSVLTAFALVSRAEAVTQRDTATSTATFLRNLWLHSNPETAQGHELTVREVVASGAEDTLSSPDLARQPEVKASLLATLAEVDVRLRLVAEGRRLVNAASALSPRDPMTRIRLVAADASLRLWESDHAGLKRTLATGFSLLDRDPELARSYRAPLLTFRAQLAQAEGRTADAVRDWRALRGIAMAATPPDRDNAIISLIGEGSTAMAAGDLDRAQPLFERVVAMRAAMGQPDHPSVLTAINELGAIAAKRGDMPGAERRFRRAIDLQRRIQGDGGLDIAFSRNNLGRALVEQRRFGEALAELDAARRTIVGQAGANHASLANLEDSAGLALGNRGQTAAARLAFDRGLSIARANGLPKEVELLTDRAELECRAGAGAEGLSLVLAARTALARFQLAEPWRRARIEAVEAGCRLAGGDTAAARDLLARSRPAVVARWGNESLFGVSSRRDAARAGLP